MSLKDKNSKSIIHIATDEKFIDAAYDIYEKAFPGRNSFFILKNKEQSGVKYLSKEKDYQFITTDKGYISKVNELVRGLSLVVFHGMSYHQAILAQKLDKEAGKFLWSVFGGEVYNNQKIYKKAPIGNKTYKTFIFSFQKWFKDLLRPYYYLLVKGKLEPQKVIADSILKMDHVGILYKEEIENYLRLGIVNPNVQHIKFTYYPLDTIIKNDSDFVDENNILLGNSASYTNNHLEAFDILEKLNLENHDIITPLSYGNKEYASQIVDIGNEKFGPFFKPVTEFLPLFEYQKILQGCGIVIMNHYRQQAVGNVMNAIYLGAKIYLSNKNTLYHYLKRIGCHVYCIEEDLVSENRTVFDLLSKNLMIENRAILKEELSLERVVNELKQKLTPVLN